MSMASNAIDITVKTVNNASYSLNVPLNTSVVALKGILKESTSIPEDRQRLIYRGRVLQDECVLNDYQIACGHVLHMVARPENFRELQQQSHTPRRVLNAQTAGTSNRQTDQSASLTALAAQLMNQHQSHNTQPQTSSTPSAGSTEVRDCSLEHIRQGLLTTRTLISTMEKISGFCPTARQPPNASKATNEIRDAGVKQAGGGMPKNKKFFIGQWLDVKDTVSQWLEATVMDMNEGQRTVYIHYNGWPVRWDEWITWDSPRLAPFRSRTAHPIHSQHSSPSPLASAPHAPQTGIDDLRTLLPELAALLHVLSPVAQRASNLSLQSLDLSRRESQTAQMQKAETDAVIASQGASLGSGAGLGLNCTQRTFARGMPWSDHLPRDELSAGPTGLLDGVKDGRGEDPLPVPLSLDERDIDGGARAAGTKGSMRDAARSIDVIGGVGALEGGNESWQQQSERRQDAFWDEETRDDAAMAQGKSSSSDNNDGLDGYSKAAGLPFGCLDADSDSDVDDALRRTAEELCPLLDRLGRVFIDLAPHLREFALQPAMERQRADPGTQSDVVLSENAAALTATVTATSAGAEQQQQQRRAASVTAAATAAAIDMLSDTRVGRAAAATVPGRSGDGMSPSQGSVLDMSLSSLLRPGRPVSPPPERAYRSPIATSPRTAASGIGGGGGSGGGVGGQGGEGTSANPGFLDIHIAILSPPRRPSVDSILSQAVASLQAQSVSLAQQQARLESLRTQQQHLLLQQQERAQQQLQQMDSVEPRNGTSSSPSPSRSAPTSGFAGGEDDIASLSIPLLSSTQRPLRSNRSFGTLNLDPSPSRDGTYEGITEALYGAAEPAQGADEEDDGDSDDDAELSLSDLCIGDSFELPSTLFPSGTMSSGASGGDRRDSGGAYGRAEGVRTPTSSSAASAAVAADDRSTSPTGNRKVAWAEDSSDNSRGGGDSRDSTSGSFPPRDSTSFTSEPPAASLEARRSGSTSNSSESPQTDPANLPQQQSLLQRLRSSFTFGDRSKQY